MLKLNTSIIFALFLDSEVYESNNFPNNLFIFMIPSMTTIYSANLTLGMSSSIFSNFSNYPYKM